MFFRRIAMKFFIFTLLAFCILISPLAAYADLIFEPESDFYEQHQNLIIYLGRSFSANGEDGSVFAKKEPGSKSNASVLQNGTVTYMQYSCLYDGDFWGFTYEHSGWVKLSEMLVLYDYVAFEEEYFPDLYLFSGDYVKIKETRSAIAWPWPGADAPLWTLEDLDMGSFRATYAYMDDEGREWGFVTYLYGSRNIWFCLSDPLNPDLPALIPAPEPSIWESETAHVDILQYMDTHGKEASMLYVIIGLVAVLVIGTAVLIKVFWKPDETEQGVKNDE